MKKKPVLTLILIFLCSLVYGQGFAAGVKRIFLLHSYHQGFYWTDAVTEGVKQVLHSYPDAELAVDYLDSKRFPSSESLLIMKKIIARKIQLIRPDLIIVSDNNALMMILEQRNTVYKGIPVVFCGINNYRKLSPVLLPDKLLTGIAEQVDFDANIRLMITLHPGLRRIWVVNDRVTTTGKIYTGEIASLQRYTNSFGQPLQVTQMTQGSMEQLTAALSNLAAHDAVLVAAYNRDDRNKYYSYQEVVRRIALSSDRPVYGVWQFMFGNGIIGGVLVSGRNQGMLAARYAVRILSGESPFLLPVIEKSANLLHFDYRQLIKHSVPLDRVPKDAEVFYRGRSFYEKYSAVFWITLVSVLTVAAMYFRFKGKRRQALNEHFESEKRYRHLADAAFEAIIVHRNRQIIDVNRQFEVMTGFSRNELLGSSIEMLVPPADLDRVLLFVEQEWEDKFEAVLMTCNGTRIQVEIRARHFNWSGARVRVAVIRDITERLERESRLQKVLIDLEHTNKELSDSRESLQKMVRTKDLFFSIVAHDLMDPQHSLVLGLQMLRNRLISQDAFRLEGDLTDRLYKSALSVYRLVQNLLDWSKLQMENYRLRIEPVNISTVLDEAATVYSELLLEKQLRLAVQAPHRLVIHTDKNALSVILRNLVHNSVKFTEEGGTITLKATSRKQGVLLTVADNGIGIPSEIVSDVERVHYPDGGPLPGPDNPEHGLGLGLTVCKVMIQMLSGEFTLSGEPGHGTEASVYLPDSVPDAESDSEVGQ